MFEFKQRKSFMFTQKLKNRNYLPMIRAGKNEHKMAVLKKVFIQNKGFLDFNFFLIVTLDFRRSKKNIY